MNNMHHAAEITNGMLYDLIRDMKEDISRRFDEVDKRFEMNERRITSMETDIKDIREKLNILIYDRDKVKITFSRTFAFSTIFFSALIAYVVALFSRN